MLKKIIENINIIVTNNPTSKPLLETKNPTLKIEENYKNSNFKEISLKANTDANQNTNGVLLEKNSFHYHHFTALRPGTFPDEKGELKKYVIPGISLKGQKHILLAYQGNIEGLSTHYPLKQNEKLSVCVSPNLYFFGKNKNQLIQFLPTSVPFDPSKMLFHLQSNTFFQADEMQQKILNSFCLKRNKFIELNENYLYLKSDFNLENKKFQQMSPTLESSKKPNIVSLIQITPEKNVGSTLDDT